jgi:hypothetical protein
MTYEEANSRSREIREELAENERFYSMGIKTYSEFCETFQSLNTEAQKLQRIMVATERSVPNANSRSQFGGYPPPREAPPVEVIPWHEKALGVLMIPFIYLFELEEQNGLLLFLWRLAVLAMLIVILYKL